MSQSTGPRRTRAPGAAAATALPRFEGYPYLVSRIGHSALRHIMLVPSDWTRERVVTFARGQADANRFETVACFGPGDAVYVAFDGSRTWPGETPTGIYATERLRPLQPIPDTAELVARRAWLEAIARTTRGTGGYIVGDGLEHGERARPQDRIRLGGRGRDGLPVGLRRCGRCGEAAGDYLLGGTEIIRCWCACENHNRCARCQLALADHRLSAWFWSDDDAQAWYLAAYAGFSHRCPDERQG